MNKKLFTQLKTDHASLGLADDVLQAYADSLAATGLVTDENLATVSQGQKTALKTFQSSFDKVRGEKSTIQKELDELKAKGNAAPPVDPPKDDIDAKISAAISAAVKPLQDTISAYETKDKQSARQQVILSKAKELGIPDWRISEGFNLPETADDETITSTLSKVKQNIVAASLDKAKGFPVTTDEKVTSEQTDSILSKMKF